ncbi:MAG: type III-B CRISPR-associated protein Cas10/Cmr2, partial [Candidatus Riflebacteria bacterium]|nr:type III-B CRISPR-associated protein Cas10/Cmr2 [Candidatus Riflebacteria bacterium]
GLASTAGGDETHPRSDGHPLFAATLPNRFVAIVPEDEVAELATKITEDVRDWIRKKCVQAWNLLVEEAGLTCGGAGETQIEEQLRGFPEVTWASATWDLSAEGALGRPAAELEQSLRHFSPQSAGPEHRPGFFATATWSTLEHDVEVQGQQFFAPNPGILYPGVYDLLDRAASAAKTLRVFDGLPQKGGRCTLCGEREWLTADRAMLSTPRGQDTRSVWALVSERRPDLSRRCERLCAPCTLKRLWPTLFVEEVSGETEIGLKRYVISTHTMALAPTLDSLVNAMKEPQTRERLRKIIPDKATPVALPARIVHDLRDDPEMLTLVRRIPGHLDDLADRQRSPDRDDAELARSEHDRVVLAIKSFPVLGRCPEAYYSLMLMDGDRMGRWVSGTDEKLLTPVEDHWHRTVREAVEKLAPGNEQLGEFMRARVAGSPARHAAISAALNGFSSHLARYVVEEVFKGKMLYCGGDDLMAMLSVDDLVGAMFLTRCLYSGVAPFDGLDRFWSLLNRPPEDDARKLQIDGDHVLLRGRLFRLMGARATASIGAVIAHHQAPLGRVLRELRAAERRAKGEGGRNALSICVIKRSGGALFFTSPWYPDRPADTEGPFAETPWPRFDTTPPGVLLRLTQALACDLSRRAAYHILSWIGSLPTPEQLDSDAHRMMLEATLRQQLSRQRKKGANESENVALSDRVRALARDLVDLAATMRPRDPGRYIEEMLPIAEFMAREGRFDKEGQ